MQTQIIILSDPKQWEFVDQSTGVAKRGNSAVCFLPFEGIVQKFSNLPLGVNRNVCYACELGFRQVSSEKGLTSSIELVSVDQANFKVIDWKTLLKK